MTGSEFDLAAVRQALPAYAGEIAVALLGEPNRGMSNRRELRFRRKGALVVAVVGPRAGQWFDHELGVGGDLLDLIRQERGGDFLDALRFAASFVGSMPIRPVSAAPSRAAATSDEPKRKQELALRIWNEAKPIAFTLAAAYLAGRKVLESALAVDGEVLRFHENCPFERTRHPCLIALMRDVHTNEPRAIQRTALTIHGEKIDRRTLGPKSGAAIKLAADEDVTIGLAIGEGLETMLSAMSFGFIPAWALGDAGELARFPVLAGIEALTIVVDHDTAGQAAASECSRRWAEADREVIHIVPRCAGEDLNDCIDEVRPPDPPMHNDGPPDIEPFLEPAAAVLLAPVEAVLARWPGSVITDVRSSPDGKARVFKPGPGIWIGDDPERVRMKDQR
jgi:hypothetical protein